MQKQVGSSSTFHRKMKPFPMTHPLQKRLSPPAPLQGAVGNMSSREPALAGAVSAARHTTTWEGATYPTSAGLSAALLASQRSTTALDGTVASWVCRRGEKRHNEYSWKNISPHPTTTPCAWQSLLLWYSSRVPTKPKNCSPEGDLETSSWNHSQPCSHEGHMVPHSNKFWSYDRKSELPVVRAGVGGPVKN